MFVGGERMPIILFFNFVRDIMMGAAAKTDTPGWLQGMMDIFISLLVLFQKSICCGRKYAFNKLIFICDVGTNK